MNTLNWILMIILAGCIFLAWLCIHNIRKKADALDGMCGVQDRDDQDIRISAHSEK